MRRNILSNAADGRKKPVRYITTGIIAAIGVIMSITACGRLENTENVSAETGTEAPAVIKDEMEMSSYELGGGVETSSAGREDKEEMSSADRKDGMEISSADIEDATETSSATEDSAASTPIYASISEEIQANLGGEPLDIKLTEVIEENVILSDDTEIEACEWVDEKKSCLRIRVQYKEPPPDNYRHKEDYFFFQEGENIQALYVDYPTKDWENMEKDRYVWDACDFVAHLEDVTFDGKGDLIIFLGYAGSHADTVHGAYIYEDGFYHYNSSFERIPNYMVDTEKQFIRGHAVDSAMYAEDYVFIYEDDEFVKVSYHYYRLDYDSCR